nr:hypothetical protein [Promineifilum sp.]
FHGELDDLRYAYTVDGVGPRKQAIIDEWRDSQQRRLPTLLADDFPDREAIMSHYEVSIERLEAELAAAEMAQAERRALLQRVEAEGQRLRVVTVADFERLLLAPDSYPEALHRFQLGLFPPWEPPPDWFVAALEAAQLPAGKAPAASTREQDIHVLVTPSYLKSVPSPSAEDDLSQLIRLDD